MAVEAEEKQRGPRFDPFNTETEENYAETNHVTARSSLVDSFHGCGLRRFQVNKEELKKKMLIPEYLRNAMMEAITKNEFVYDADRHHWHETSTAPEAAVIVFINSNSGGHHGPSLKARLQELISEQQMNLQLIDEVPVKRVILMGRGVIRS